MKTDHQQSDLRVAGILIEIVGHGHGMLDGDTLSPAVNDAIINILHEATGGVLSLAPMDLSESGPN